MFPFALEAGINAREFWYYTIAEINTTILGYQKRLATRAAMDYKLADLIGASVSRLLSKEGKFPSFNEAYPSFATAERPQPQDWRVAKERLQRYADAHNAKVGVK